MSVSKSTVRKFAENIVLRLDSCIAPDTGQITRGSGAGMCGNSGIYDARRSPEKTGKEIYPYRRLFQHIFDAGSYG